MIALSLVLAATLVASTPLSLTSRQIGTQVGSVTAYDVGLGACGRTSTADQHVAAVSHLLFDTFPGYNGENPADKRSHLWKISYCFIGKSIQFTVVDRCLGCGGFGDLDFSTSAFIALAGSLGVGTMHEVVWSLN